MGVHKGTTILTPRPMMVAKFYSKRSLQKTFFRFFEPIRPRMTSKFAELLIYSKNVYFFKMQLGLKKTQNLMLISNPLKKLQKTNAKTVINDKVTDKCSFCTFIAASKSPKEFSIEFCVMRYDTHIGFCLKCFSFVCNFC